MTRTGRRLTAQNETGGDTPLLRVRDLAVSYRASSATPITAVKGVSFDVTKGSIVLLAGESGSGKTSIGMTLAGFNTGEDTRIAFNSLTMNGRTLPLTKSTLPRKIPGISMIFQDAMTSLDPVSTVGAQLLDTIRTQNRLPRRQCLARAVEALAEVGLHDHERILRSRPYELSGGMRQRVMLALALASRPQLLIADEPTSALDASLARSAVELMVALAREHGTAMLIISHDIPLFQEVSDHTLVMWKGDIVEQGPTPAIATRPQHPYTKALMACVPSVDRADARHLPTLRDFLDVQPEPSGTSR